jgi:hypothetical protein
MIGIVSSILVIIRLMIHFRRDKTSEEPIRLPISGIFLGLQLTGLPVAGILLDSVMYAGLRQHIYVLPAIAGLAALGAVTISQRVRKPKLLPVILAATLIGPVVDGASLFPFQFVYKNALAAPVNDRRETDLHWVSAREALQLVPSEETLYCYRRALVAPNRPTPHVPEINECSARQVRPFTKEQGLRADGEGLYSGENAWTIARKYRGSPPAPQCTSVENVTRTLRGERIVISYVLLCDLSGRALSE